MIKTRLVGLLSHAKKYIVYNIIWQWIALLAQILAVFSIAGLLEGLIHRILADQNGTLEGSFLGITALILILTAGVRFICERMAAKASFIFERGTFTSLCRAKCALRIRVSISAIGSVNIDSS